MKRRVGRVEKRGIDTIELMEAMDELEKSQGIKKDVLMESIEQALVIAYKRNFECSDENIKVVLDKTDGQMHVYQEKEIVEELENDKKEMLLDDAKKINKNYQLGDIVQIELMPKEFGRIAAQTAKQIITQKIREASRDIIFTEFAGKKGEIVTGLVQKADGRVVIMDLGKIEGIMPKKEQISTEHYNVNDKIKACIISVEKGVKGSTQIIVSRASIEFVKKLFEIEIPEIYEGVIEIKSISREAGSRSKVAVFSPNPNIDPVGSCVGQKGIRIQNIINELHGEKIDVIEWNEDPSIFISVALAPAKVLAVDIKEDERFAQVIVPDDQLSLAIGKAGQNAKLAARLTEWKIDIKSESQFREMLEKGQLDGENKESNENDDLIEDIENQDEVVE
ncbi:MAG: transcription termination/antitermination protein NusA [Clostridia bacterium]|nr:transcription termination/antitermination protein NusA [Clostridia bacterium]